MTSTQAAILALLVLVLGETRRVPENYATIQEALDVAAPGDKVSVGPGSYNEHVRFMSDGVILTSRVRHQATIDGGGTGHVVVCGARTATVEGFVITGSGDRFYAGVFTSQASQVIRDNVITGNRGDGISVSSGSLAVIERNVITDNGAWHAGIQCVTGASATIADNYIARNRYGIHCSTSGEVLVINNTILDHTSWSLYFGGTSATVVNNILAGAEIGILFASGYAPDRTGYVGDHLTIAYNDVWQNSSYDYYAELITIFIPDGSLSNVGPFTPLPGTGEMSIAPLLDTEGVYHLLTGSPCINRGDPSLRFECYDTDIDGHARVLCGRVDMGAYEFGIGDYDCDQSVDLTDFASWSSCMTGATPDGAPYGKWCEHFDFEFDGDVDLKDFAGFQRAMTTTLASNLTAATPGCGQTLPRSARNCMFLDFDGDVTQPPPGAIEIRELLPGGGLGPNLSAGFAFTVEESNTLGIRDIGSALGNRRWYAVINTGGWAGVNPFKLDLCVLVGDVNNDGAVTEADVPVFIPEICDPLCPPCFRGDLNGDGRFLMSDVLILNMNIGSTIPACPTGHSCCSP